MEKLKRSTELVRCSWVPSDNLLYQQYHDEEWGRPLHDDNRLFEMLILEGAQAGLSWETILKKRLSYRRAFKDFDVGKVAAMPDKELAALLEDSSIIRNRLKIYAARTNALAYMRIQEKYGSFNRYIWSYVDNRPIVRRPNSFADFPTEDELSRRVSQDLRKWGMIFVGPRIIYAYMQAVGLIDEHMVGCFKT